MQASVRTDGANCRAGCRVAFTRSSPEGRRTLKRKPSALCCSISALPGHEPIGDAQHCGLLDYSESELLIEANVIGFVGLQVRQRVAIVHAGAKLRQLATPSPTQTSLTAFDGLGHTVRSVLTSDPKCASGDRTDTTYDGFGHVHTVSNPYCTTSDPTYGLTTYAYDALGRTTQVTRPDNSTILTNYIGRATQVQDEGNGTQRVTRISQSDGLGRLVSVCEVSSATLPGSGGAPTSCGQDIPGTGFLTTYKYNALDDLTQVNQGTLAPRTFTYNSLDRLVCASNPENSSATCPVTASASYTPGTTGYSYDANGNLTTKIAPAPNQKGTASVTTTYSYDALNRLTKKSYSDTNPIYANGTPSVLYGYDASSVLECSGTSFPIANSIGRMSWSAPVDQNTIPITMHSFSYDSMGRTTQFWQCPPAYRNVNDQVVVYDYNLIGNPTDYFLAVNQAVQQGVVQNFSTGMSYRPGRFNQREERKAVSRSDLKSGHNSIH